LNGDWLLDFAPRADFQAATNPTQGLIVSAQGFGVANRAVGGFLQTVSRNRPFGVFQQLSGYRHGWLSCLQGLASFRSRRHLRWLNRLSLHLERNPIPLSQKPRRSTTSIPQPYERDTAAPGISNRVPRLGSSGLRHLDHYGDVQRRSAPWTALSGRYPRGPQLAALPFDAGRHGVRADRTQHMSFRVINRWRFHDLRSPLHPTLKPKQELYQNRKEL
jgi:hypothetical protein